MSSLSARRVVAERPSKRTLEDWLTDCTQRPGPWLAVFAALLAVQISPWWYPTPDTVVYLSTARSLAISHTLATLGNPQIGFPPGYPLLISPAFLLGERPFLVLSIIHWCMAVVFMLGVYRWARRSCPDAALLLTGLVMVNVSVWIHYRRALSELAFMTVLIWTVQSLDAVRAAKSVRSALARAVPASALLLLLSTIREVGVLVAVGFGVAVIVDAWRPGPRRRPALLVMVIVGIPAAVAVAGFVRYDVAMKLTSAAALGTHLDGLTSPATPLVARFIEGLRVRIGEVGRLLIPGMFNAYGRPGNWFDLNVAVYVPVFVFVVIGWWRLVRRRYDVFALTVPFYFVAYTFWPFEAGARYILPMLPVLLASVWCLIELWPRYRLSLLAVLLIGHLGVALGHWMIKDIPRGRDCHAQWGSVERLVAGIPADAPVRLTASVPQCVQLMLAFSLDRAVQVSGNYADDRHVRWIVMPDAEQPAPGYSVAVRAGAYKLLVRE